MGNLEKGSIIRLLADCRAELIELREKNKKLEERVWRLKEDLAIAKSEIAELEEELFLG